MECVVKLHDGDSLHGSMVFTLYVVGTVRGSTRFTLPGRYCDTDSSAKVS